MKRNGACIACFIKRFFGVKSSISSGDVGEVYPVPDKGLPPMGWSSWNTFANNISEELILETATAMKDKGLLDAGYSFVNLDDCWHSSLRDENGLLQGDLQRFPKGIAHLVREINELGFKAGIYSSNGSLTCEDLPASEGNEYKDALTFAGWGVEFVKYDFCHNIPIPKYAPLIYGIFVTKRLGVSTYYPASEAEIFGDARYMPSRDGEIYVSGLDRGFGVLKFKVKVPESGNYVITVKVKKLGLYEKYARVTVNGDEEYEMSFPSQHVYNDSARFQLEAELKAGENTIEFANPVATGADSARVLYRRMGRALLRATKQVATECGMPEKPITFSICEWGWRLPYKWAASCGNLWRTTPDIKPFWPWIKLIYRYNVRLGKYASRGHFNDPDMLEVGVGKLTMAQNRSHFALWCMMSAPLILGNDIRKMSDETLSILKNKALIAIDQDELCKPAKRVNMGTWDLLVKELSGGGFALCLFNKSLLTTVAKVSPSRLNGILGEGVEGFKALDAYEGAETDISNGIYAKLPKDDCKVLVLERG